MKPPKEVKPCTDISFAQDCELFEELSKRYTEWVFCAMRPLRNKEEHDERILRWRGSDVTAIGLLDLSRARITGKILSGDASGDAG